MGKNEKNVKLRCLYMYSEVNEIELVKEGCLVMPCGRTNPRP